MKRNLSIITLLKLLVPVVLAGIVFILVSHSNTIKESIKEEENEENESPAEVTGAFDMWGAMRSYPDFANFQTASYHDAFNHSLSMPDAPRSGIQSASGTEGFSAWTPLGAMNFSGRILCLAFDPTTPNIMFAGAASGGLWKTTNGGTGAVSGINWTQVQTGFPIMGVPAIAINPSNHNEIYIGTGEVYNTGGFGFGGQNIRTYRGSYGIGILKSTDGGTTWASSLAFTNSSIKGIQKILIDPATPSNVFAATSDGVYRSTNSGGSWTLIHSVIMAMDICFEPGNSNTLYVGCGDFASAGNGIYKCTNALVALPTFTKLSTGLPAIINGAIRLNVCPNNVNLIYASIGKIPGSTGGTAGTTYGLFKSTDGGATWAANGAQPQLGGSNYIQNQGWYSHDVIVAPTTVNTIYVSEIDMLKSSNGGTSFSQLTNWSQWDFTNTTVGTTTEGTAPTYVHADHHHLYFSPFDATYNTIFVVTDGGVFKSTNGGTSFIGLNGGLMTQQIYHKMSVSATNTYMLCGLQDNATLWYTGSTGCKRTTGGDGFYTAIDPTNANICFGTYSYMTLYRSTTGPGALGGTTIFSNPASPTTSTPAENACFVAPVVMAPSDHNRMYGGTINFKKSTNNGSSFANIGAAPLVNGSAPIIAIGVSATYPDSVYVASCPGGAANPKILKSINGGTNFTDVTGTLPNRYFTSIAVDPTNSKRVAVSVSGFGTSHLYLTIDAGVTWTSINGNGATALPDVPANVVIFDPTVPSNLYVGNDLGVYAAQGVTNGASAPAWFAYNTGLTDATMVMDLLVAPNGKLRMGTYGKGLWENNLINFSLPVEFKDFNVAVTQKGNELNWTIASQSNVDHYEIEYSTDGINYTKVGAVPVSNLSGQSNYKFLHGITNTVDGYYRIKSVDLDGASQFSIVKKVKAIQSSGDLITYPNPTSGLFTVKIPGNLNGKLNLMIYDNAGKMVMNKQVIAGASIREFPMNISNLSTGNYRVICTNGKTNYISSIIKK